MAKDKPKCEAKTLGCNGQVVRVVRGPKKNDPVFRCCIGCRAVLSMNGTKLKDATEDDLAAYEAANKPTPEGKWASWTKLFTKHPRPWCSGIDTNKMKGGILDAQGRLVVGDDGSNRARARAVMLAFAVNELSDMAIKAADNMTAHKEIKKSNGKTKRDRRNA